jgi:imidazolonepropionase-like amidohydrolase
MLMTSQISRNAEHKCPITTIFLIVVAVATQVSPVHSQNLPNDSQNMVLQNVSVIDVVSGVCEDNMDIVVKGQRISSITMHDPDRYDKAAKLIDLTGKFAIPGLIEGHTHISGTPEKNLTRSLGMGLVALRDMGGDGAYLMELQEAVKSGELSAPDIHFSALMGGRDLIINDPRARLSTPPSYALGQAPWMRMVEDSSDFKQIIQDARDCGATGIKMYAHLTSRMCSELAKEAKKEGLKVWAHSFVYPATVNDVVRSGVEVVSHASGLLLDDDWSLEKDGSLAFDSIRMYSGQLDSTLSLMKEKDVVLDPTLVILKWQIMQQSDDRTTKKLCNMLYEVVRRAYERGVKIVAGTDDPHVLASDGESLTLHEEMEALVINAGLPPIEALRAATINNAEILGIDSTQGSLEVGKLADLVILDRNPLDNIENIRVVNMVIKSGEVIKEGE